MSLALAPCWAFSRLKIKAAGSLSIDENNNRERSSTRCDAPELNSPSLVHSRDGALDDIGSSHLNNERAVDLELITNGNGIALKHLDAKARRGTGHAIRPHMRGALTAAQAEQEREYQENVLHFAQR